MRAIKFRVWDGEKHKMFPVRELFWRQDPREMVGNYWDFENEHDKYGRAFYFPHTDRDGYHDNFILMQFTGLLDKNGKEVYEGDIVNYLEENQSIAWSEQLARPILQPYTVRRHYDLNSAVSEECEIIGNIYEHPDLLKEQQ